MLERLPITDVVHDKDTSRLAYAVIVLLFRKGQIQLHIVGDVAHLDLYRVSSSLRIVAGL